jgi:hypothetical protein
LPDDIFVTKNTKLKYVLDGLGMENVGIFNDLLYT